MLARLALALWLALTAGCSSPESPTSAPPPARATEEGTPAGRVPPARAARVTRIEIRVHRPPGQAYCTYSVDGAVRGGHLSGDDPPFVHEDTGRLEEADRAELFSLAERAAPVMDAPPREPPPSERVELAITREDDSALRASWPFGAQPDEPELRALTDVAMRLRVGGW